MQSSTPKVSQCEKCNGVVFSSDVNGCRTLVDPTPIPAAALIAFLTTGRALYEGINQQGKLHRLRPSRTLDGPRYAQHGCTVGGTVRAQEVELAPVGPPSAPATPGGSQDGFRHPLAPDSGSQGHTALWIKLGETSNGDCLEVLQSHARNVSHPRSDDRRREVKPTRCTICKKLITGNEQGIVAIEYDGRMVWAEHVEH